MELPAVARRVDRSAGYQEEAAFLKVRMGEGVLSALKTVSMQEAAIGLTVEAVNSMRERARVGQHARE